jgi:hypothetical protein
MLDPFTLAAAITFFGTIAIAAIAITIRRIVSWFRNREQIKAGNAGAIAFTLADRLENKRYTEVTGVFGGTPKRNQIVQGFYDTRTGRLLDARAIASSEVAEQQVVEQHEAGEGLVIYR